MISDNFTNIAFEKQNITTDIEALGHDWSEWNVTRPATAKQEGEETRTCSRCDEKETRSIPKMNIITLDLNGGTLNGKI